MNASDEIAALATKVQQLEADLREANAELDDWQERWDRHIEEAAYEAEVKAREMVGEFVADVRRGIRTLDEFEAVCS